MPRDKPKIFVTRPLPSQAIELLGAHANVEVYPQDSPIPPEQLASACRDATGLLVAGTRVTGNSRRSVQVARHLHRIGRLRQH